MRSIISSALTGIVTSGGFLVLAAAVEFTLVNGSQMPVNAAGNDFAAAKPTAGRVASSSDETAPATSILPSSSGSEVSLTPPVAAKNAAGSHTLASDSAAASSN